MAICAVSFSCDEEIELTGHIHFGEHRVPDVFQDNDDVAQPWWKFLFDIKILLMGCKCHTFQLVAHVHLVIAVVEKVVETRYVIELIFDAYFHGDAPLQILLGNV